MLDDMTNSPYCFDEKFHNGCVVLRNSKASQFLTGKGGSWMDLFWEEIGNNGVS
jgi:hypothetical protein